LKYVVDHILRECKAFWMEAGRMNFPLISSIYAGIFGILLVAMSVHVVVLRARKGIHHGDGNDDLLNRTIRSHANFAEHVPMALLLVAMIEGGGGGALTIHLLLLPLLIARLMHPIGMRQPVASMGQYAWRATSVTATWLVLLAASTLLLAHAL
jgi:uncharacterized membrane protein YecN with MAPEG domain